VKKSACVQALLAGALARLERYMGTLQRQGFAPMEGAYTAAWLHSDQQVGRDPRRVHAGTALPAVAVSIGMTTSR